MLLCLCVVSFGDQVIVAQSWKKDFKGLNQGWDSCNTLQYKRSDKVSASRSSSSKHHCCSKELLLLNSWKRPGWVVDAVEKNLAAIGHCKHANSCSCAGRTTYDVGLGIPQQADVFWAARISQHIKCGQGRQALKIYREMRDVGVEPSTQTYVIALKACSSLQDLQSAKQIHSHVVKSGCELDLFVGTMLVSLYAKCGSIVDARLVFEKMPHRDVVSWTALIFGYAQEAEGEMALQLYTRMQQEGIVPRGPTFIGALKACSSLVALKGGNQCGVTRGRLQQVRSIHSDIVKGGFESDVHVVSMLVDVYAKCGNLVDARHVFEKMPHRNVVSWTSMISGYAQVDEGEVALQLYARMQQEGQVPNARTFISALKACSSRGESGQGNRLLSNKRPDLNHVIAIHSDIQKYGFESNLFVGNMLVDSYAKCGNLVDARRVFEKMARRDVVSWNAMILGYAQMEQGKEGLQLYSRMQREGLIPNERTFVSALKACSNLAASFQPGNQCDKKLLQESCLEQVKVIHADAVNRRCESSLFVGSMLVDVYAKCSSLVDARHVFDKMLHHDVVSWNAMISGYAQMGEGELALELYRRMQEEGVAPDARTFVATLKACGSLAAKRAGNQEVGALQNRCLKQVRAIHSNVLKRGFETNGFVGNVLVDVYAKCGSLVDARRVFEQLPNRDVVSWTALILGYAERDDGRVALELYSQMQQEGLLPNERTLVGAINACGSLAGLEKGVEIHDQISRVGLATTDLFLSNALVDMYGKCGSMDGAQQVFDVMPTRDIVTWNALIAGYARQGESQPVFQLFHEMQQEGIIPDDITLLCVLTVCSHAGLVDKGQKYFQTMSRDYGITPTMEHYNCMVDLLGRAGHLYKVMAMVKSMPFQPNAVLWRCVLGACRKWKNVELGRHAFERAVELDKNDAAAYLLMSSIYASAHMREEVKGIQAVRLRTEAWKQQGQSWWTDRSGIMHAFAVSDQERLESQCLSPHLQDISVKMLKGRGPTWC